MQSRDILLETSPTKYTCITISWWTCRDKIKISGNRTFHLDVNKNFYEWAHIKFRHPACMYRIHARIRTVRKYWHCALSVARIRATFNKCSIRWHLRVDHNLYSVYNIEAAESKFKYCLILAAEYLLYNALFYILNTLSHHQKMFFVQKHAFLHEKFNFWTFDEFFGESKCLTFSPPCCTSEWQQMPEKN